jgi:restriction system protein
MPIPSPRDLDDAILQCLADGQPRSFKDIFDAMGIFFHVTSEEKEMRHAKSGVKKFDNYNRWSLSRLSGDNLITTKTEEGKRGVYKITVNGLQYLAQKQEPIDNRFLRESPGQNNDGVTNDKLFDEPGGTPDDIIERNYEIIRRKLADDLLDCIHEKTPEFFERLVLKLLVAIGYGGSFEDAAKAVGQSGNGGIDGIIKEDKLGLDSIYVQAKRWQNTTVGRPEIQRFVGALAGQGAKKGIFITASSFSKEARDFRPHNDTKVVLLDGQQLAQLMIDYNIGVSPVVSYEIKRVDNDFFEED